MSLQPTEIDLKEFVGILQRQIRLIVISALVTLGMAGLYLMLATPKYQATALISIDAGGSNLLDPSSVEYSQSAILNSRVDGEVEILRAAATVMTVVERADLITDPEFGPSLGILQRIGIALGIDSIGGSIRDAVGIQSDDVAQRDVLVTNAITALKNAVDIRRLGLTYLISVGVESEDPKRAAEIANIYVATYIERQVQAKTDATIAARDVLRRQIETARTALAASEGSLNTFIDDNLSRIEQESGNQAISALRGQLESAQANRIETSALLASSRDAAARSDWSTAAESLGDAAMAQLATERADLARRLSGETGGTQQQVDLQQALAKMDEDLKQRLSKAQSTVQDQLNTVSQTEDQTRAQLREVLLQSDIPSSIVADLFNLQQSSTIARNQYQTLLSREQDLGAMANIQIADARVVSEALPPITVASPKKKLILALALAFAISIGVSLALLNEYYIGGITSPNQLRNVIQAPVPVAIPAITGKTNDRILADEIVVSPLSPYAESFRKLRSAIDSGLRQSAPERTARSGAEARGTIVLICSALPGEGKTTAAIALARTYAVSGVRTLLIDCDLRKPSVAEYLHADGAEGLLDYLNTNDGAEDPVIHPVRDHISDLIAITAGSRSNLPTDQLINSARFAALLGVARSSFDTIILDSPPLLPVVDTRYLAQHADIAVQVVRFANTTQSETRDASHQVQEMLRPGVRLLGVLNRQVTRIGKRGYYNGEYNAYYGDTSS